jgi:hypothetical protein
MQTVNDVNDVFQTIVTNHQQLKSFYTHSVDEVDIDQITIDKFPLLYAQVTEASVEGTHTEFTYEVFVATVVFENQRDFVTQIYSETLGIMQDVIAEFHLASSGQYNFTPSDWSFEMPVSCEPFTAKLTNSLTGWSASFTIKVPSPTNLCNALY